MKLNIHKEDSCVMEQDIFISPEHSLIKNEDDSRILVDQDTMLQLNQLHSLDKGNTYSPGKNAQQNNLSRLPLDGEAEEANAAEKSTNQNQV